MGVYSQYDSVMSGSGNVIAADESYEGAIGAYQMIEESEINSYNIFESVIGRDFAEAGNGFGVVSESDMEAINEASASGIWQKVVDFVQKIWAKIKGILNSIKTKIQGTLTKDGKALYKKYEKTINSKLNNGKLSDFKFKWKKIKDGKDIEDVGFGTTVKDCLQASPLTIEVNRNFNNARTFKEKHSTDTRSNNITQRANATLQYGDGEKDHKSFINAYDSDTIANYNDTEDYGNNKNKENYGIRPYTSDECTDMLEEALGYVIYEENGKSVTAKEFAKEYRDEIFDDEEELDKFSTVHDQIISVLSGGKKILEGIDKAQRESDRYFKDIKKKAVDITKAMQKANEVKTTQSKFAAIANRTAGRTITCLNIMNRASGMSFAAATSVVKEHIKQCRAVWIKAAAYNQKKAPYEEATLLEAMADVSDYEVETMFSI